MVDRPTAAASNEAAPDPLIGRVINEKFKILGFIAKGGMGKVYRAEQTPLGRICAVKVLNANYTGEHDPEFHKRFFLEASMTSKLRHPNTVTIFDYGQTTDGVYYMAMEYLEGYTLHRAIRQVGYRPEERTAHLARQICRPLREAHTLGVVHRDLKPANVYLLEHGDEPDFVKVLDFGLVKDVSSGSEDLTKAGLFMGSPKYMAPEQINGDTLDGRADIYALGVIMYEMVTGKVPFDRPKSLDILMAHAREEVPPIRKMNPAARVSPALEEAIMRSMAKKPSDRFRSMDEALAALKRLGAAHAAEPSASMTADRPGSGPTASRIVLGIGAASAAMSVPDGTSAESTAQLGPELPGAPAAMAAAMAPDLPVREGKSGRIVAAALASLAIAAGLVYARSHASSSSPHGTTASTVHFQEGPAPTSSPSASASAGDAVQAPKPVTQVDFYALPHASAPSASGAVPLPPVVGANPIGNPSGQPRQQASPRALAAAPGRPHALGHETSLRLQPELLL